MKEGEVGEVGKVGEMKGGVVRGSHGSLSRVSEGK